MLPRTRLKLRAFPIVALRWSSTVAPTRSPKDLYNHLSQFVIGQEHAKRILSVAVFNHYRRIEPLLPGAPEPQKPPSPQLEEPLATDPLVWAEPRTFEADFDPTSGVRDATRVVGAEAGSDPTLTHSHEALSREEKWARGDGYFNSKRPPSLLGDMGRRSRQPDTMATSGEGERAPPTRRKKHEDDKREARRMEEAARARRVAELAEGLNGGQPAEDDVVVEKSNVLMIGPTGTGKTLMAKTLARALDVPFVSCDATTYTQAGYVGEDVESCILRLLQAADYDVSKAEVGIIHIDEVDKLARRGGNEFGTWGGGRDVGGEGVQQALLRVLEGTTVILNAKSPPIGSTPPAGSSSHGPGGSPGGSGSAGPKAESSSYNEPPTWDPNNPMNRTFGGSTSNSSKKGIREGLPGFSGGGGATKGDQFVVDTSNILFILSGAFVGLDSIIQRRLGKGSIGFNAPLASPVAAGTLKASSADLKDYGLIPEFLGRLPILSSLHALSIDDLIRILTEPRNALIKQYKTLFRRYGSELGFTHKALEAIAQEGLDRGGGARGLRGVLEEILVDAMFEVPGSGVCHCLITAGTVARREPALYFSRGQRHAFQAAIDAEDNPRRTPRIEVIADDEKMRAVG